MIDSGLFHVFSDDDRRRYVDGLASVLIPGGRLSFLCFSDEEPGTQGPRRVSRKEIEVAFAEGYKIHVAYDGEAALEAAKTHLPDVILLDLGMPSLDGVHLARFFREDEQLKDKVLIAITGYADQMHRSQCDAAGIDFVFPMPAAWEDLKSTIDRLWAKRKTP